MATQDEDDEAIWRAYESGIVIRKWTGTEVWEPANPHLGQQPIEVRYAAYHIEAPGTTIEFRADTFFGRHEERATRRARLCDAVIAAANLSDLCTDPDWLPTDVAVLGKPYIAAYMAGITDESAEAIAERLDVSRETVRQYLSDVRTGTR